MTFRFFMLQIRPGSDDTLFFAETAEECHQRAQEHRLEVQDDGEYEVDGGTALPIYQCIIKKPDRSMMLDLLNSLDGAGQTIFQMCLLERHVMAPAIDQN